MESQLVVLGNLSPLAIFTEGGGDSVTKEVEAMIEEFKPDISTAGGRAEIKSLAYKISRTKTGVDDMRKDLVSEAKQRLKVIDAEGARLRVRFDELRDIARKPLTDYEDDEKARIKERLDGINAIELFRGACHFSDSDEEGAIMYYEKGIESVDALLGGCDWQEFNARAVAAATDSVSVLKEKIHDTKGKFKNQRELEDLRKEKAEREQKDRDESIAKEAADKATREAEEKAQREKDDTERKQNAERERIEREKQEAIDAAASAEKVAREAEKALQREKDEAEKAKKAADEKARIVRAEKMRGIEWQEFDYKAEAARIRAEEQGALDKTYGLPTVSTHTPMPPVKPPRKSYIKTQIEAECKREDEDEWQDNPKAQRAREADIEHKSKVNNEALEGMFSCFANSATLQDNLKSLIGKIVKGNVPHVKITY